jgi:long-chain acyl-CoA synthetase
MVDFNSYNKKKIYLIDSNFKEHSLNDLLCLIDHYSLKLKNIKSGQKIYLVGDFNHHCIAFLIACTSAGHIVFPQLSTLNLSRAEFNYFAKLVNDQVEFSLLQEISPSVENDAASGQIGFFSSGTTGIPKIIFHDFNYLWSKSSELKKVNSVLLYLKFDHLGGINTLFTVLKSGKTAIAPPSRIPQVILDLISTKNIELLPTTPSFLDFVIKTNQIDKLKNSKLKVISFGAEPMSKQTAEILNCHLSNIKLVQVYGLTELKVFKTKSLKSNPLFIKIIEEDIESKIEDDILKIKLPNSEWFNTNDLVEAIQYESEVYYRILGRSTDYINIGGEKFLPQEIESVFLKLPEVISIKVFANVHETLGKILCAEMLVTNKFHMTSRDLREYCLEHASLIKTPVQYQITTLKNDLPIKKKRC